MFTNKEMPIKIKNTPIIGIRRVPIIPPEIPHRMIIIPITTSIRPEYFFFIQLEFRVVGY